MPFPANKAGGYSPCMMAALRRDGGRVRHRRPYILLNAGLRVANSPSGSSLACHEIARRRTAESAAEHAGEGARALVAEIERDTGHRLAIGEAAQRIDQPHLLAPGAEAHAGLTAKEPRQRAARRADLAPPRREGAWAGGIA